MKKLLTQTTTLIALLLCMVTTSACFDDEEDTHDPQAESNLVGVWQGHSDPLAEWRIEFCPDGTARVTQYALDFGEYDVWIVQDYHFNSWKAHNGNFYIGDYYDGRILSDKSISLNSRLVGTDGEVIFVTLYKTTEDNFPAILDHQERARKLIGIWEGMGDDGTYARRLELEKAHGLLQGKGVTYHALETELQSLSCDVSQDTVTIVSDLVYDGTEEKTEEQGIILNDSTLRLPGITLRKQPAPEINNPLTVQKAIGTWVDTEGNRMTLKDDMTAHHNSDEEVKWRTVGNDEVQILPYGRDDIYEVVRFILNGDDLVCYPALPDSPKYVKQN